MFCLHKQERHIDFIDHLRGVAILSVLLFHVLSGLTGTSYSAGDTIAMNHWDGWVRDFHPPITLLLVLPAFVGWVGVPIFFVISGFCIHLSHQRSREKGFKTFFIRRFFRLYPPYLLALVVFAASRYLRGNYSSLPNFTADVATHLFMVHNYGFFFGINAPFWSLAIEAQLYLIYPLFLGLVGRYGWQQALCVTAGLEVTLRALQGVFGTCWPGTIFDTTLAVSPFAYWYSWTIGAALAEAYLRREERIPFCSSYLWLCLPMFVACWFLKGIYPFCFTLAALLTAFILGRLLRHSPFRIPTTGVAGAVLSHVRSWGILSYSAYLLHGPIVNGICYWEEASIGQRLPILISFFLVLAIGWACVFPISYLFNRWVEDPSTSWGKRLLRRRSEEVQA